MNREELAWAAGFFDGEGCSWVDRPNKNQGYNRGHLRLKIQQVEKDTLMRFQKALNGLGTVRGPYGPYKNSKSQPIHEWAADNFEHVQAAIAMMWTFLSPPKREQYIKAVSSIQGGD